MLTLETPPAVPDGHAITAPAWITTYVIEARTGTRYGRQTWFTWSCQCGAESPEGVKWSHAELARRMADVCHLATL